MLRMLGPCFMRIPTFYSYSNLWTICFLLQQKCHMNVTLVLNIYPYKVSLHIISSWACRNHVDPVLYKYNIMRVKHNMKTSPRVTPNITFTPVTKSPHLGLEPEALRLLNLFLTTVPICNTKNPIFTLYIPYT
jgi:hypothetical protein